MLNLDVFLYTHILHQRSIWTFLSFFCTFPCCVCPPCLRSSGWVGFFVVILSQTSKALGWAVWHLCCSPVAEEKRWGGRRNCGGGSRRWEPDCGLKTQGLGSGLKETRAIRQGLEKEFQGSTCMQFLSFCGQSDFPAAYGRNWEDLFSLHWPYLTSFIAALWFPGKGMCFSFAMVCVILAEVLLGILPSWHYIVISLCDLHSWEWMNPGHKSLLGKCLFCVWQWQPKGAQLCPGRGAVVWLEQKCSEGEGAGMFPARPAMGALLQALMDPVPHAGLGPNHPSWHLASDTEFAFSPHLESMCSKDKCSSTVNTAQPSFWMGIEHLQDELHSAAPLRCWTVWWAFQSWVSARISTSAHRSCTAPCLQGCWRAARSTSHSLTECGCSTRNSSNSILYLGLLRLQYGSAFECSVLRWPLTFKRTS